MKQTEQGQKDFLFFLKSVFTVITFFQISTDLIFQTLNA